MEKGYVYIVSGEKYAEEANYSVQSLKKQDTEAHVTIVSDEKSRIFVDERYFDKIVLCNNQEDDKKRGFDMKVNYMYDESPYEKTFFVDSDTYFVENCRCLFSLLKYYDLCTTRANNDDEYIKHEGKSIKGYGQYNTGVILFKKASRTQKFFADWQKEWSKNRKTHSHDQMSFMLAMLKNSLDTYLLKNNWNARSVHKTRFIGRVKLLHGRHDDVDLVSKRINTSERPRLWVPEAEVCMYNGMSIEESLRLAKHFLISYLDTSSVSYAKEKLRNYLKTRFRES